MGPPIHYYGDMNMAEDQDKNNMDDLEKMIKGIVDEVFADWKEPEEEGEDTDALETSSGSSEYDE